MLIQDPLRYPQPKPHSGLVLCGNEWVEKSIENGAIYPVTVVRNSEGNALPRVPVSGGANRDHESAVPGKGVKRIANQVGNHLLNFFSVA